ncbi:sensor histidine kinase [Paenibacillus sp. JX-17]|uniref:Sensor histidine kinase n=1 Tax=Paenibacillus lacisoli TaxID=3064525 RepID=A0ABT9CEL9_9BACL|nr:sensor histidine kinase [Paenibacillus sp. JX-17]MDO7907724.1 sensor histidine kinase [Paenibacillus sp. JX-17]
MHKLIAKFRDQRLFVKMFIVMVVSIITVSLLTSWITVRMSERLFMNTFSITNSKVLSQIKANFDSFNYSMITALNNAQQSGTIKSFLTQGDTDSLGTFKNYYNMEQAMKRVQSNVDANDLSVTMTGINGRAFSGDRIDSFIISELVQNEEIKRRTRAQPDRLHYQYYLAKAGQNGGGQAMVISSKILAERTTGESYGMIYFTISEQGFRRLYANFTSEGNDVAIIEKTGRIVSSNRSEWVGQFDPALLRYALREEGGSHTLVNAEVMGRKSLVLADDLPSNDLYLVNIIDKDMVMGQVINMKTVLLVTLAIAAGALIIVFLISRQLTKSLTKLVKQMSSATKHDLDNYITVTGSYEIRELGNAYNGMLDELHDYVDRLVETQKEQRNAELAALQRQINPHFLYNTLASIKFLVQQGGKEKAAEMINALISLLQNTISNVSETISVADEVINLKNYVYINQMRYGERIRVNYLVAPDCMNFRVPKLIIQPFIENAFFHAFNKKTEGFIHVLIAREGGDLLCEIVDNGDGMDCSGGEEGLPNAKSKRQLFTGIGVQNVHDRIKLLYGEYYGVNITSQPGQGTRVTLRLPQNEEE